MATRMQQRRGTAAEWAAANPVLAAGEVGYETNTKLFKVGDGVSTWSALTGLTLDPAEYVTDSSDLSTSATFDDPPSSFPERPSTRYVPTGSTAAPPVATTYTLFTAKRGDNVAFQIAATRTATVRYFIRSYTGADSWGAWDEIFLTSQKKTVRMSHTFTITGEVKVASGDTNFIPGFYVAVPAGATVTVASIRGKINSGTSATVDLRLNDANFGLAGLVVIPGGAETFGTNAQSARVVGNNNRLNLVVTAVAGTPKNMNVTVFLDYTF